MVIPDVNVLLAAYNLDHPRHPVARSWRESTVAGQVQVGLAWVVMLGFIRLTSNRHVFEKPWLVATAVQTLRTVLAQPAVTLIHPGSRHMEIFSGLVNSGGLTGNMTTDAHLAALALEYGARMATADSDFASFDGLDHFNPLDEASLTPRK